MSTPTPKPAGLTDDIIKKYAESIQAGDSTFYNSLAKTNPQAAAWLQNPKNATVVAGFVPKDTDPDAYVKRSLKPFKPTANQASTDVLKYPSNPIAGDTDYVVFGFYKYDPPFGRGQGGDGSAPVNSASAGYNLYAQSGIPKTQTFGSILLYMPEDIQSQYSAKWAGAGFGSLYAGLARTVGTDITPDSVGAAIETMPGVIKTAIFDKLREGINKVTGANVSINQFIGGISGTVLNPNVEMMYDAPDLRGFDLTFKMTPRSNNEAAVIRKICNRFKKAMLPTFGGQALFGSVTAPNLLTIPSVCQVSFMKGNDLHPFLPQYKLCAITDVSVNYTPDGSYATFEGGSPVATQLKITFKEMKLIFEGEINEDGVSF